MKEALKEFLRSLIELIDGGKQIDEERREMALIAGHTMAHQDLSEKVKHNQCNHRKGGMVRLYPTDPALAQSIAIGLNGGNGSQYSVRKHQMMNGDIWVDCLRCGKKWRPPVVDNFTRKNWFGFTVSDIKAFERAVIDYNEAVNFETNNTTSTSIQCMFHDRKTGKRAEDQVRAMYAAIGE